ncbi:unnamed protein product [Periconia digitata]|uniref:Zn(2)-C6 fungal-type domain-containing protein n=1 Tax=Periconia digitata TaxID=1303443 RepID=A0A9W4U3D8_9PLEO|nr:unnamed protein product [Periconia digitata]
MAEFNHAKRKRRSGTRRKTGCHTCKTRHSRCDEKKPVCSNCERLNLECKPSEFISASAWNIISTTQNETPSPPVPATHDMQSLLLGNETPSSTWDIFRPRISGLDLFVDDSPPNEVLTSLNLLSPPAPMLPLPEEPHVTLTPETAFLFNKYVRTVATWLDLMDHENTYQTRIPRYILSSPLLFHSVCAFTARHLSLCNSQQLRSTWENVASSHYGEALQLMIRALNQSSHEHVISSTILLSSYEIASGIASEHHRKHLLGQSMLIKYHKLSARSTGEDRANFWIHVRHEIGVALATERPLMLDPMDWGVMWHAEELREDVQGNQVLWILARVINLIYGEERHDERQRREGLHQELETWRNAQLHTFVGIPYGEHDEDGFRKVCFTVTAAAAGTFWYHVTRILLYAEPVLQDEAHIPFVQDQAKCIGDIAISEFPDSLRVFASHGLYYAAKHIEGLGRKARIWGIMNAVEEELGYSTRPMVRRLQAQIEGGGQGR